MGKFYTALNEDLRDFIARQKIFFVATAPLSIPGHINLSPKGLDSFRVLADDEVAYLDITGSGNETSAHLLDNGRITLMFCAFEGAPNILRIYGTGHAVVCGTAEWAPFANLFPELPGPRQVIVVKVHRVQTSCGYSIPYFTYTGERDQAAKWAAHKGPEGLDTYRKQHNLRSMDGLETELKRQQEMFKKS